MHWFLSIAVLMGVLGCRDHDSADSGWNTRGPIESIPAGSFIGRSLECPPHVAPPTDPAWVANFVNTYKYLDSNQSLPGFEIDRLTASCIQYESCVVAGACAALNGTPSDEVPNFCSKGNALTQVENARRYCAWRGGHIPSFLEWQRAMRGTHGEADRASVIAHNSEDGVVYAKDSFSEWTSDVGCLLGDGLAANRPLMVILGGSHLNDAAAGARHDGAVFRCAYAPRN